jgi:hypothetical protein
VVTLLALLLAQITLGWRFAVFGVVPDFWLLAVAAAALRVGTMGGAIAGFAVGLGLGLAQPVHLAVLPACALVLGAAAGTLQRIAAETNMLVQAVVAAGFTAAFYWLHFLFVPSLGAANYLRWSLEGALYSAVLAPFFFWLFGKLAGPQERYTLF